MYAKVLIDNITKDDLAAEWGLAVYIQHEGHSFLLDTGASGQFWENAAKMGIDLSQVEFGVLSHAHYDHGDGMAAFFEQNKTAPFYLRAGAKENCYGRKHILYHYNGIQKGLLKQYADRIRYADGDYEIVPGVTLVPHKTPGLEKIGRKANMYVRHGIRWVPDAFAHEQSLVLDTKAGLVIFNSCSHGGADHIIREVAETYPDKQIYALIGGFHLYRSSQEEVRALAKGIRDTGIQKVYTGHCTGQEAFTILKEELGDQVQQLYTGLEIRI